MRKSLIFLVALVVCVAGAKAQVKPFNLYAGIGATLPSAPMDFKNDFKKGLHYTAGLGFSMGPSLETVGKISLHSLTRDWDNDNSGSSGGKFKATLLGADIRLTPSLPGAPYSPFLFAGIGLALISPNDIDGSALHTVADQDKVYYNLGGGFEFRQGPLFSLYIESGFVSIGTSGHPTQWIPITVGLKF